MTEFREATSLDVKALQELALVSYGRLKTVLTPENWTKMESVLLSDQTFPLLIRTCYSFVCETKGRLTGMAFLVPSGNPTKIYSPDTSYIRMVGVHPDAGGKGIARSLTRLCIEKAKASGEKKICLHSAEIMHAARHIYESEGFKKIKILDEHYGLEYWLYEMDLFP
jgi:ribosomal protein S18 acetylase RimI-like enzyme